MLRLLLAVAVLVLAAGCAHRDISNPYAGPDSSQPLP
jgi:type IV pilus biogenesis protein CpaD/CtpE